MYKVRLTKPCIYSIMKSIQYKNIDWDKAYKTTTKYLWVSMNLGDVGISPKRTTSYYPFSQNWGMPLLMLHEHMGQVNRRPAVPTQSHMVGVDWMVSQPWWGCPPRSKLWGRREAWGEAWKWWGQDGPRAWVGCPVNKRTTVTRFQSLTSTHPSSFFLLWERARLHGDRGGDNGDFMALFLGSHFYGHCFCVCLWNHMNPRHEFFILGNAWVFIVGKEGI